MRPSAAVAYGPVHGYAGGHGVLIGRRGCPVRLTCSVSSADQPDLRAPGSYTQTTLICARTADISRHAVSCWSPSVIRARVAVRPLEPPRRGSRRQREHGGDAQRVWTAALPGSRASRCYHPRAGGADGMSGAWQGSGRRLPGSVHLVMIRQVRADEYELGGPHQASP